MENQKTSRAPQQSFSNNNMSIVQQSTQLSAKSSGSPAAHTPVQSCRKGSGHYRYTDSTRTKSKGRGNINERTRGNAYGRSFQHTYGGGGGHQRRFASHQQNHEVIGNEDRSGNSRSAEKVGRHGENASHLLNFTYNPRPSQVDGGSRRPATFHRGGRARKQAVHTKEQFLQAHCQFVVKDSFTEVDYVQRMAETDKMIDWEDIEQVILRDEHIASCPICMEVPVAAKITKCAHIYCWPCMLHYLSLTDKAWGRCPICFDSIEEKDLKSVMTRALSKPKVGDEITLYLMKRERESLYVRPKSSWRAGDAARLFAAKEEVGEDMRYSKLLSVTTDYIETVVREERRQLLALLCQDDTQSLEASFIQAALDSLSARMEKMGVGQEATPSTATEKLVDEIVDVGSALPSTKSAPNLTTICYSDAFEDVCTVIDKSGNSSDDGAAQTMAADDSAIAAGECAASCNDTLSADSSVAPKTLAVDVCSKARIRNVSSASSSDGVETEQIAADLVLPPTGTQPGHSSGSKRTEVYYFYQAADGQLLYLHSINTRVLAAQYGSLEMAPAELTATIVEVEDNSMTPDLRRKLKYLSHLPLYSQFSVCEVVLRPPVVSSSCLAHFTEEINERKRKRNRRQRTEARQYNRAQAEERRRMGKYPDMSLALDSDRHFPSSAGMDSSPPPLTDYTPLPEPETKPEEAPPEQVELLPSRQQEVPLTTPYSFAQAMKGNSPAAAVWPKVQASYVRTSAVSRLSETEQEGAEGSAPSFQQSFSADFSLKDLSRLSVQGDEANETSKTGKKGKGKKKKQQVLFSTSSQRPNH